jgi:dephospho-CoA kinase
MAKRLVIGLTGSFGTGKTTAARIFKRFGARDVIEADRLAHEVFRPRHPIGKKIESVFKIGGNLDRKKLAAEIFRNPVKRSRLEAIIHPYVLKRIRAKLKRIRSGVVILEVPLLFEARFDRLCDQTVSVLAPERLIVKRLARRGFSAAEVRRRLKAQLSQSAKRKRSDFIIFNSGSKKLLVQRTNSVWKRLKRGE